MSTGTRLSFRQAATIATEFYRLFTACYSRWEIAGSLRREARDVGDAEHVVIPKIVNEPGANLFAEPEPVNLLWRRLDELIIAGTVQQALYKNTTTGAVSPRWGDKFRGVMFGGIKHEISIATQANWGNKLLICTGPWQYSRWVVDQIKRGGVYRQQDGFLRRVDDGSIVAVATEEEYCRLAGIDYIEPRERGKDQIGDW